MNFPKRKKCPRCIRSGAKGNREFRPAMNMLYIRIYSGKGRSLVPVGWFCRNCGKMMRLRKMDI